jgi:hypothetical protein
MANVTFDAPWKLELPGGLQLFQDPDREWLTLTRRGLIKPVRLAARVLRLLSKALTEAETNDIVLTMDCIGAQWELHAEFTKECLDNKPKQEQLKILSDMMPRRVDEYLSTTFNITDKASLFASATAKFNDQHAMISVPLRELQSWLANEEVKSSKVSAQAIVAQLTDLLVAKLGPVEPEAFMTPAVTLFKWRAVHDRFARNLIGTITSQG